jgi:acetyl-CoA synthetase
VPDPDGIRGDIVKAFIVLRPEAQATDELAEEIQQTVRKQLAAYEYPRQIEFLDELPLTTTGKVRRLELRQRELQRTTP